MTNINDIKGLLTKEQFAVKHKVSSPCVDLWISTGKVVPVRILGRILFHPDTVVERRPRGRKRANNSEA